MKKIEEAKIIQEHTEKNVKIILNYLVGIPQNKSNKNLISGVPVNEIEKNTNLSLAEINDAVKYMEVNKWLKSIHNSDHEHEFMQVWVTDKGRIAYKEQ